MKNKFLLLFILLSGYLISNSQTIIEPYQFPVKPGTEEWKKLKSGRAMVEACSIPDLILTSLTTEALTKTCLAYPLLNEIFYANNLQRGIEGVIRNFNGLSELLKKKRCRAGVINNL